jgi:hypothetical protein
MSKPRSLCISIALLLILAQAAAPIISASLSPTTLTATLRAGESIAETKSVFLPGTIPKADIVFAFDATGSMAGTIATAQAQALNIMNSLSAYIDDVQFGVMSHRDYNGYYNSYGYKNQYGYMGDYPYNLTRPITSDHNAVKSAMDSLIAGYGYDYPESYARVMYESYSDSAIGWRPGAKHILIMLNDAVPHDDNLNEGVPGALGTFSTGGDPGRDAIMFTADDLDLQTVLAEMATNHVTLLVVRMSDDYFDYWAHWADITGGSAYMSSESDIPSAIRLLVGGTAAHVHKLTLKTEAGYEAWLKPTNPSEYAEINIPPEGITETFTVNITAPLNVTSGVYHFKIIADADGANYGEQEVTITIIPEFVVPELWMGTIAGLAACLAALGAFRLFKRRKIR